MDEASPSVTLGITTCQYKALSMRDAEVVVLRRLSNTPRLAHELYDSVVGGWRAIMPHPHIVTLREVVTSRDFDDLNDLIFVYDFHAVMLQTLS
jgi:hypothetical protein|eukprot:COSAG01_NODE_7532_length_3163_cov_51.836815_4_plen_94_part_00